MNSNANSPPAGPAGNNAARSHRLPKASRLRKSPDFDRVRRTGSKVGDPVLRIGYAARDGGGPPRLGLAVGRRLGNAVVRNRIKRVIRSAWREAPGLFPDGLDLVIIPVASTPARRAPDVGASLRRLAARIRKQCRAST